MDWIREPWRRLHQYPKHKHPGWFVSGFGVKCYSGNLSLMPGILQIAIDSRCLIVQMKQLDSIPLSLFNFLGDKRFTFVGLDNKVYSLYLYRSNPSFILSAPAVELSKILVLVSGNPMLQDATLDLLMSLASGFPVEFEDDFIRNNWDTEVLKRSDWNAEVLSLQQVLYALVEVSFCFKMGKDLLIWDRNMYPWLPRSGQLTPFHLNLYLFKN